MFLDSKGIRKQYCLCVCGGCVCGVCVCVNGLKVWVTILKTLYAVVDQEKTHFLRFLGHIWLKIFEKLSGSLSNSVLCPSVLKEMHSHLHYYDSSVTVFTSEQDVPTRKSIVIKNYVNLQENENEWTCLRKVL